MFEVTRADKHDVQTVKFVGRRYTESDRNADGNFKDQWQQWLTNGWFTEIENIGSIADPAKMGVILMEKDNFSYWIGYACTMDSAIPDGCSSLILPEGEIIDTHVHGSFKNGEILGSAPISQAYQYAVARGLAKSGTKPTRIMERFDDRRFNPNDDETTVDYCFYG
ncbi:GyrI-like domain-containing protein [Levilactobacillus bambusae]|uniref:AraC family transcriptional regulator n=1 Tax=Levilactobacillus bambusae TaxID=2024736 RepID=A0A2V1MZF1_9LACO|nr:GyrI-like domain-containing protein [Levilactobacillus bambusae]PWF99867.1 hypothetical protein DCM90_07345 [Levilactobacillus bambusae]